MAAERAVEYARMVGAREIEMDARLTLAGLMVASGDVEGGLAELVEVNERTVAEGISVVAGRSYVNLPSSLQTVGRSREAVPILETGLAFARKFGQFDKEAWIWGNLAESLFSLGRWDEAAEAAAKSERVDQSAPPRGFRARLRAELALARGDLSEAGRQLAVARQHFGTHDVAPQHHLPLERIELQIATAEGRLLDARATLELVLDSDFLPGTYFEVWPLLVTAAVAETQAIGLPVADPGRPEILERIRRAAKPVPTNVPVWQAHERWLRAELRHA